MKALFEALWPRDFQKEVARDVELRGLFNLMRNMTEGQRIIKKRSRHSGKRENGDMRKSDNRTSGPSHHGAGAQAGA